MATAATPDTKRLELSVSNFGPIAEGRIELRPFTVFVGPSNTGKSYLATLIYALHRFFASYPPERRTRRALGHSFTMPRGPAEDRFVKRGYFRTVMRGKIHYTCA